MKNFKDILKEYRENIEPNRDRGGNDPHQRVIEFLRKTPFTHVLTGEHTLNFNNSYDAAKLVSDTQANHNMGADHAFDTGDTRMGFYFAASTGTHDDVLDSLENHIRNHPKLPRDLVPHVGPVLDKINLDSNRRAEFSNLLSHEGGHPTRNRIGEITYKQHNVPSVGTGFGSDNHPHLLDDEHHLRSVIDLVRKDPDMGYYLRKEEYKD
jgi:hypothetical protein